MNSSYFAGIRPRLYMTLLASAAIATTGCSNMTSSVASSGGLTAATKVGGKVHGGNQPVAGATVNLYFASQATFAAGATLGQLLLPHNEQRQSLRLRRCQGRHHGQHSRRDRQH